MKKFLRSERAVTPTELVAGWLILLLAAVILLSVFFGSQFSHLCHGQRRIAHTTAAQFKRSSERSKRLLPRANIPGITHAELIASTAASQREEAIRVAVLEDAANKACRFLP